MLTWKGQQGAGEGQPAWAGPQGHFRLQPCSDTPTGAAGLNPQSVSCTTWSTLLAYCQPALKGLSEGHKGPLAAHEVAAIFISLPN